MDMDVDFFVDWHWQLNSGGEEPLTIEMALARAHTHTLDLLPAQLHYVIYAFPVPAHQVAFSQPAYYPCIPYPPFSINTLQYSQFALPLSVHPCCS